MVYPYRGKLASLKMEGVLIHVTAWMDIENMRLSEMCQTQKTTHVLHDCTYNETSRKGKSIETISRLVVARGWGEGKMGSDCLMGAGSPLGVMKMA